ncbi:MAG: calcium-binding protein [Asticcacaulis sp.]
MTSILNTGIDGSAATTTANSQDDPQIFSLVDGGYVVIWDSDGNDGNSDGVFYQRYDASGHRVGGETQINSYTTGSQYRPLGVGLPDGGFVISWTSPQDGSGTGIYYQRFNADGSHNGLETRVNTTTTGSQDFSGISATADGGFVITWSGPDASGSGVYMQRYTGSNTAAGGETLVNTTTLGDQSDSVITTLANGNIVVAWDANNQDGDGYGVYSRVYSANGTALTGEILVNTGHTSGGQFIDAVTALSDGGYIVGYQDNNFGTFYLQRYSAGGTSVGSAFTVPETGSQTLNGITALSDGGFALVYDHVSGSQVDVHVQRYDADGNVLGDVLTANTYTVDDQDFSRITALNDGGFAVTWRSFNQDGSGTGVYQHAFTATTSLGGTQILYGTGDADDLDGGSGNDLMYGGKGDDVYQVNSLFDTVQENVGEGEDLVISTVSGYQIGDNVEELTLAGSAVYGYGNTIDNVVTGNNANNFLYGFDGDDVISAENGNDTLSGGNGDDTLSGGSGNDIFYGGTGTNTLDGEDGDDVFFATSLVINALAKSGDNDLDSVVFDNITGGHGIDTYDAGNISGINANLVTGKVFSGGIRIAQLTEVENVKGSASGDVITGDGGFNQLYGYEGNDTLDGGANDDDLWGGDNTDTASYASATAAVTVSLLLQDQEQDTVSAGFDYLDSIENLTGSKFNDTLTGDNGNNLLDGGAGADVMKGGLGDDTYVVGNSFDNVGERLNEGTDTVLSSITYTLTSNVENLTLTGTDNLNATGNAINNTIIGNSGNNLIDGGAGADKMYGGVGDDTYVVNNGFDQANENTGEGTDTVQSSVTFTIGANVENLTLTGTTAINGIGNTLANIIAGNSGNNILTGGAGNDTFVFGKFGVANGLDHLVDFVTGTDHLSFTGADYGIAAGHVLGAGELSLTGVATSAAGVGQFIYNTTTHTLSWDSNGVTAGGVTDIVVFNNAATPHAGDFIFT